MSEITKDDLYELKDDVLERISGGFAQTNQRLTSINGHLSTLNGRVGTLEVSTAEDRVRIEVLTRGNQDGSIPTSGSRKRNAIWMSIGGGLGVAAFEFAKKIAEMIP